MSNTPTHSLCNKFQKWINLNSLPSLHAPNTRCSHSHTHPHNNHLIMNSPYKKTTFETVLRKYPHHELQSSRITSQNESKENPKRTFENRMIKYDNIKSKIDTNLANIKQAKLLTHSVNDQNQNTQNLPTSHQQTQYQKLEYQKPLIKKIKLNSEFFQKFQQPKDQYDSCLDLEDLIIKHRFMPTGFEENRQDNGKTLFRINVAKKINLLNQKDENTTESIEQCKTKTEQQFNKQQTQNAQNQMCSQIILQNSQNQQTNYQKGEKLHEQPMKLLSFQNSPKMIFKQLGEKVFKVQQNQSSQEDNNIFTLDGFRILEQNDSQMENYHTDHYFEEYSNLQGQKVIQQTPIYEIENNYQEQSPFSKNEEIPQFVNQDNETKKQKNTTNFEIQAHLPQKTEIQPLTSRPLINSSQDQPFIPTEQKQNINQNIQPNQQLQNPKPKSQKQRLRRNSKPKKETKILTRSKEQRLNLFNQLSMRLIRKKYGQDLTHSQLADKMLSQENKIQLKAFIQIESFESHKTVFDFNELTLTQMRNTLIKYFVSEQKTQQ